MIRCPVRSLHAHRGASTSSVTTRTTRAGCACRWPSTGASRSRVTPHPAWCGSTSESEPRTAVVPLDVAEPASVEPAWARYVAGIVAQVRPADGFEGTVSTTLPAGVGLSSSAALEVAVALAIGADDSDPVALARLCQAAEHAARGVPTGILDQISSICGLAGHALLLDCHAVDVMPVPLPPPDVAEWVVLVPAGGSRDLATSGYSERRRRARLAPRRRSAPAPRRARRRQRIAEPVVRRRARHVVTENGRVQAFAEAIGSGDLDAAGALMNESHASLRDEFESSTPAIDRLCADLAETMACSALASPAADGAAPSLPSHSPASSPAETARGSSARATALPARSADPPSGREIVPDSGTIPAQRRIPPRMGRCRSITRSVSVPSCATRRRRSGRRRRSSCSSTCASSSRSPRHRRRCTTSSSPGTSPTASSAS